MPRRADIQGLRALAVLLVIAYHAGLPVPGGFTGVDIFFAISGFVITGTLLAELSSSGRISFSKFYIRRVRRLLPALAVMLLFVAVAGVVANPIGAYHLSLVTGVFASLFSANLYLGQLSPGYFDVDSATNPLLHTWTLGVEEQFYVVFPALLAVGWWLGRSRRTRGRSRSVSAVVIAVVCVVSFLASCALSRGLGFAGAHEKLAFYSSPARAWEFGIGALIALAVPQLSRLRTWGARTLGFFGVVAIAVAAFSDLDATNMETSVLLPVVGACLLLVAGVPGAFGPSRLLGVRPVAWVGDLSYSLYLWHWPLIVFAKALWPSNQSAAAGVAALVAFLPAWLSYKYVENPIRFHPRLSPRKRSAGRAAIAVAGVCVIVPILANLASRGAREALNVAPAMKSWNRASTMHADVTRGCQHAAPLGDRLRDSCTWKVSQPRGEIVLFGDSLAGQFSEPVIAAGNRVGFDVTVVVYNGCPYLGIRHATRLGEAPNCARFGLRTLETIERTRPSLVILAARSDSYIQTPKDGLGFPSGELVHSVRARARLWREALSSALERFSAARVPAILIHPTPMLPLEPRNCAVIRVLTRTCVSRVDRSSVRKYLSLAVGIEKDVASGFSSISTVSFENEICDRDYCATVRDGTIQYRDEWHLTIERALELTEAFGRMIAARAVPRDSG